MLLINTYKSFEVKIVSFRGRRWGFLHSQASKTIFEKKTQSPATKANNFFLKIL